MLKKVTQFIVVILLTVLLISPTIVEAAGGIEWSAADMPSNLSNVQPGDYVFIRNYPAGFYCLNHELSIVTAGTTFYVYETGLLSQLNNISSTVYNAYAGTDGNGDNGLLLSFLMGAKQSDSDQSGTTGREGDDRANYIWNLLDWIDMARASDTYQYLEDKYKAWKTIYDEIQPASTQGTNQTAVTITPSNPDIMVADNNGRVGPFTIQYPYDALIDDHIDKFIIKLNDTTILFDKNDPNNNKLMRADGTPFQIEDTEFYVNASDVNYGQENKFSVEYDFVSYKIGRYAKLTPRRQYFVEYVCKDCGAVVRAIGEGYYTGGENKAPSNWVKLTDNTLALDGFDSNPSSTDTYLAHYHVKGFEDGDYKQGESNGGIKVSGNLPLSHIHVDRDGNKTDHAFIQTVLEPYRSSTNVRFYDITLRVQGLGQDSYGNIIETGNYFNYPIGLIGHNFALQDFILLWSEEEIIPLSNEVEVLIGKPNIKLELEKVDSLLKNILPGVQFEITVENGEVKLADGSTQDPYTFTTGDGNLNIEIKPDNGGKDIDQMIVHIKEIKALDNYLEYKDEITITFTWDTNTYEWKQTDITFPDRENATWTDVDTNSGKISIENREKIELSGHVWIDVIQGNKHMDIPNGKYDMGEELKAGIKVFLYKSDGTQVTEDGYGNTYGTDGYLVTDSNGSYKFENLPKLPNGEGYYIVFEYDGITYIRTYDGESKATEKDRATFNNRFKTISKGQSNDGTSLEYNYDGNSVSKLITTDANGTVLDKFVIKADTLNTTYNETTEDIDLGLREKTLDLSLLTDINSATVSINGKSEQYEYNTFNNLGNTLTVGQNKTAGDVTYRLDLYSSDYHYRISDYIPGFAHQPGLSIEEDTARKEDSQELKVELTYLLVLNNQSTTEAQVNKVAYYYDANLKPTNISGGIATDDGNGKLTIIPDQQNLAEGEQVRISITFELQKLDLNAEEITNYAEIMEYSTTDGGFIDTDSAPDDAFDNGTFKYEDDSDEAHGLKVVYENNSREITGYVFEDVKAGVGEAYNGGNGTYDSGENLVDDVIVQLIEIKDLTIGGVGFRLEYIWQETTSGSNVVSKISDDGKSIESYNVTAETGKYTFRDFIPGNYIIRFIYGDGTYFDQAINSSNILKYNGQDYKSTVDKNYNKSSLMLEGYATNSSMARDNEARRLETLAYALGVTDINDLRIDSKEKLENTWMAAETSKVNVEDVLIGPEDSAYQSIANFGLILKPQMQMSLRKHITGISLKGGEGNLNVVANVDMAAYSDDTTEIYGFEESKTSESHPLTAQATTKFNRGLWKVEANNVDGANLEIIYTYDIRYTGDPDYLHKDLMNVFLSDSDNTTAKQALIDAINNRITEVNEMVRSNSYDITQSYLGQAYYTGNKGDNDKEVVAVVEIEDYLGNDVTLDGSSDLEFIENQNKKTLDRQGMDKDENVKVIRTKSPIRINSGYNEKLQIKVSKNGLSASDSLQVRSYIAQVISPYVNLAGTPITGTTPNNLRYVQSYADMATLEILQAEDDEYWAETFEIVPSTGGDKATPIILAASIATGVAIIVVGIVLIKKFMIVK